MEQMGASCDFNHYDYVGNYDEEWNKEYFKPNGALFGAKCRLCNLPYCYQQKKIALFLLGLHPLMLVLDGNKNINTQSTVIVILESL